MWGPGFSSGEFPEKSSSVNKPVNMRPFGLLADVGAVDFVESPYKDKFVGLCVDPDRESVIDPCRDIESSDSCGYEGPLRLDCDVTEVGDIHKDGGSVML